MDDLNLYLTEQRPDTGDGLAGPDRTHTCRGPLGPGRPRGEARCPCRHVMAGLAQELDLIVDNPVLARSGARQVARMENEDPHFGSTGISVAAAPAAPIATQTLA